MLNPELAKFSTKDLIDELARRKAQAEEDRRLLRSYALTAEPQTEIALRVIRTVAAFYQIKTDTIIGPSRLAEVVKARHVAMFLCDELTDLGHSELGRFFERDHASILHAVRKIDSWMDQDRILTAELNELRESVMKTTEGATSSGTRDTES